MSKVVQAVNAMISNSKKIGNVVENTGEYFFLYNGRYKWSITKVGDGINLYFYPQDGISIEMLASVHPDNWEDINLVFYRDTEIGTKEAKGSFQDLLTIVKEKLFGVDQMLDAIIDDDIPY